MTILIDTGDANHACMLRRMRIFGKDYIMKDFMKKEEIGITLDEGVTLQGFLEIPERPTGLVIFAHGSGSSRFSPRNRYVAGYLNRQRMATLLTDLLTAEEDEQYGNRFQVDLLTRRLAAVTAAVGRRPELRDLPTGYFGASTGAASALCAAAEPDSGIAAVVSRGGRPDLAGKALKDVTTPVLLIVGEMDSEVLELNREAYALLHCERQLEIVPGATHLFEEPGTLEACARLATGWFRHYLVKENARVV
jgi:putative phosphoribosyl transferase